MTDTTIHVFVDLGTEVILAGRLFMRTRQRRQSATFEYERTWLEHPRRFPLDPVYLPLGPASFHTPSGVALFGGLSDSAPDRWGRTLMERQSRLMGERRTLFESDYLLMVDDVARAGAVRFKAELNGPFLSDSPEPIPPLLRLPELLQASDKVQAEDDDAESLRLLLAAGSSLGGARPKASVTDLQGRLCMAKFPARSDAWPVVMWEHVAVMLAGRAGVDVPDVELADVAGRRVLVSRRFDRSDGVRVPYLSATAVIGATDRESNHSYLEIADAIHQLSAHAPADLAQLWRRMVFNVLISNTDDHLRNHGFLWGGAGWRLAPAFDLNLTPRDVSPGFHALFLDEVSAESSLDTVRSVAPYFGLSSSRARVAIETVSEAVRGWRAVARAEGLTRAEIDRMETAFMGQGG